MQAVRRRVDTDIKCNAPFCKQFLDKIRMERELGLSFLEFNYMIMQAYDFLELHERYGCVLQMGGNDQWSNIIAGAELIRRKTDGAVAALLHVRHCHNGQEVADMQAVRRRKGLAVQTL